MGYHRLACHSEQNYSSDNDIRFTGNSRKTVNGHETSRPTVKPISLPVLINALARARRGHPAPHLVSTLIEQCKNFDRSPDAMRPRILTTIAAIEAIQ